VRYHPTAVVHHLTYVSHNENKEETFSSNGCGTEDSPFIVYRDSHLNEMKNLKRLRFVCMSDTHNEIDKIHIPHGDVFIHCGDAVKHRTSARDIRRFNHFVGQLPHKYKLFVSGNHCVCLDPKRPDQSQELLGNMTYIQDQLIDIEGVRIYGSPWRPKRGCFYRAEAFGYDSEHIRDDKWSNIPEDIDFLLTHGPAYSIRDYHPSSKERLGCPDLLDEIVTRARPRIHLFGHMHSCRGASLYKSDDNRILEGDRFKEGSNDILFVNLAIHQGKTLGEPVVIDYYYY
jgi:Icc-related predicted phosphoesterase